MEQLSLEETLEAAPGLLAHAARPIRQSGEVVGQMREGGMKLRVAMLAMLVAMSAAACSGSSGPTAAADACGQAMQAAAGVDQNADSVSDLYPVIRACKSIAEWTAAFATSNGAGFTGTATEVLQNACGAPEVANEPLCKLARGE